MCVIVVAPADVGWRVSVEGVTNDMMFRSGRKAEAAARRLAWRLAAANRPNEVQIRLRDGTLAARFACPAQSRWPAEQASGAAGTTSPLLQAA